MTTVPRPETESSGLFDLALTGRATRLELADGRTLPLYPARWHRRPDRGDRWMLARCHGATIDLGCGPGRLVRALLDRGLVALGVDNSAHALRHCAHHGVPAMRQDLFTPLPGEGTWRHVLLADGNIGIGGNPLALLRRAAALLHIGGSVLIETASPQAGLWRGGCRLYAETGPGPWFPWATVGWAALPLLARSADLHLASTRRTGGRYFAELVHRQPDPSSTAGRP